MEQNQIDLSQVTDIQLKAFAYDEMGKIEASQANLRVINQELAKRMRAANSANTQSVNPDAPLV
jgi:hypothetical protein